MLHFLLPPLSKYLFKNLSHTMEDGNDFFLSPSFALYLNDIKHQIQTYSSQWDIYKKYTNPYEYIHSNIPFVSGNTKSTCVSKYKPLSRSFFKMIELLQHFNLTNDLPVLRSFHLAEGPGGFIEALSHIRKNKHDKYFGMTLIKGTEDTDDIPGWRKTRSYLKDHSNVIIESGKDKTGNILSLENFEYVSNKYANSMDIITADGGFDFSSDFNKQEIHAADLIFAQIAFALCIQKHNGSFILKIFDSFTKFTADLIALLASMYDQVYITKPNTSRMANSERYIVCTGFRFSNTVEYYPYIHRTFTSITKSLVHSTKRRTLFPHIQLPSYFINKLEETNAIIGQQQIENIHYTLQLIMLASSSGSTFRTGTVSGSTTTDTFGPVRKQAGLALATGHLREETKFLDANVSGPREWITRSESAGSIRSNKKPPCSIYSLIKKHIQKCYEWCLKYHIPIDYTCISYHLNQT